MDLKPSICGTNALNIPSGCEDIGHFIGANNVTIMQGDPFDPTEGVTAVDKDGNTIPYTFSPASINTCTVGTNVVTYSTDSFSTERRVFVLQASAPAISYPHGSLTCNSAACEATLDPNVAPVGEPFDTMEGVSATDSHGMSVAVACLEGNPVTFPAVGTYTLHYTATDACGNVGTAERTIEARIGHFEGVTNATVNQGVGFDLTDGVVAKEFDGTVVPFTVTPNTFAECQLGDQVFTYTANGVETATRTITVLPIADPTISGISETINVKKNEEFDPLEGVTAVDGNGNTITVAVEATETNLFIYGDDESGDGRYAAPQYYLVNNNQYRISTNIPDGQLVVEGTKAGVPIVVYPDEAVYIFTANGNGSDVCLYPHAVGDAIVAGTYWVRIIRYE